MTTQRSEAELIAWMQSPEYRRRAADALRKYADLISAGAPWTFAEMAADLDIPEEVAIAGFQNAMARAGMPVRPKLNG